MKNYVQIFMAAMLFASNAAFGAAITDDKVTIGKPGSSSNKEIIYGTGGKKLTHKPATSELDFNGNNLTIGDGTTASKVLKFNTGGSPASIRYNNSTSKIEFSNDNAVFKAIGSGGGGGSGGIELLDNPGFEDGHNVNWTNSGGTFAAVTSGSNLLFDLKSATFTASGSGQYIRSTAVAIPAGLYGGACLARIMYKGGDANWKLQVVDGTGTLVVADTKNVELVLKANSGTNAVPAEIGFTCPSSGSISLQLISTAAAAQIYLDNTHLGSEDRFFRALPENMTDFVDYGPVPVTSTGGTQPVKPAHVVDSIRCRKTGDSAECRIEMYSTATSATPGTGDYLFGLPTALGCTIDSTKVYFNNLTTAQSKDHGSTVGTAQSGYIGTQSGLGVVKVYDSSRVRLFAGPASGGTSPIGQASSNNFWDIQPRFYSAHFTVPCTGWGTAKGLYAQTSTMNDFDFVNDFSAKISSAGVVSDENVNWINGNCTVANTSEYTCTFNSGIFTKQPNCVVSPVTGTGNIVGRIFSYSTNVSVTPVIFVAGGSNSANAFNLSCHKTDAEYKTRTTILGSLKNSFLGASYWLPSTTAVSADAIVNFSSVEYDTCSPACVTTGASWKFTAPKTGFYSVKYTGYGTSGAGTRVWKNGAAHKTCGALAFQNSTAGAGACTVQLSSGDYIDLRPISATTITGGALSATLIAAIQIEFIGEQ